MSMKNKIEHTTFRNGNLFCTHCGGSKTPKMPISIENMVKEIAAFNKAHSNCEKTWTEPKADMKLNETQRIQWWLKYGERGTSSETMLSLCTLVTITKEYGYPKDPNDFDRCYRLVEAVPEIRGRLNGLKNFGKEWANIVDNWDKLEGMLLEQRNGVENDMYQFMQTLIYGSV